MGELICIQKSKSIQWIVPVTKLQYCNGQNNKIFKSAYVTALKQLEEANSSMNCKGTIHCYTLKSIFKSGCDSDFREKKVTQLFYYYTLCITESTPYNDNIQSTVKDFV